MAYMITAVGAGGKTGFLRRLAVRLLREGKTVLLAATTHIWGPRDDGWTRTVLYEEGTEQEFPWKKGEEGTEQAFPWKKGDKGTEQAFLWKKEGEADLAGVLQPDGKLSALPPEIFRKLCENYDCVLVEGDGSHCMPMKIPTESEPVVPENTDEIVVVMGRHALGRKVRAVCQRFDPERLKAIGYEDASAAVTEQMLRKVAEEFYIRPLTDQFPKAKIRYVESDPCSSGFDQDVKKISLVLMASGFSLRYGGNKLLEERGGKKLYRHALDHILEAVLPELCDAAGDSSHVCSSRTEGAEQCDADGPGLYDSGREVQILVVTQYEEIWEEVCRLSGQLEKQMKSGKQRVSLQAVRNAYAAEGISASIRLGTEKAMASGSGAAVFFAADMPALPPAEIRLFLRQFLGSGRSFACMESMPGHIPTNPGAFRLTEDSCGKLMKLAGDHGAMKIIKAAPWDAYYYQIGEEDVRDIDEREG